MAAWDKFIAGTGAMLADFAAAHVLEGAAGSRSCSTAPSRRLGYEPPVCDPSEPHDWSERGLADLRRPDRGRQRARLAFRVPRRCGARVLQRHGRDVELVRVTDRGAQGNGHGMMMERKDREALGVIVDWLHARVVASAHR